VPIPARRPAPSRAPPALLHGPHPAGSTTSVSSSIATIRTRSPASKGTPTAAPARAFHSSPFTLTRPTGSTASTTFARVPTSVSGPTAARRRRDQRNQNALSPAPRREGHRQTQRGLPSPTPTTPAATTGRPQRSGSTKTARRIATTSQIVVSSQPMPKGYAEGPAAEEAERRREELERGAGDQTEELRAAVFGATAEDSEPHFLRCPA